MTDPSKDRLARELPLSEPPRISLRPASEADVPFLLALRQQTMHGHFLASGAEPTLEQHLERVRVRFECAQVIECQGRPAGLWKVSRDGRDWQLIQIQLGPELQGRGIGARLIAGLVAEAREAGAALSLHVLHSNPARRLYEKLGFRVVADGEHDHLMTLCAGEANQS